MPFNPQGEFFPELGQHDAVVPASKWAGSPFLDIAAKHAAEKFIEVGALHPIKFMADDVLVQEYHQRGKLLFVFQKKIRGEDHYVNYEFDIEPDVAAQLSVSGMWGAPTLAQYMNSKPTVN